MSTEIIIAAEPTSIPNPGGQADFINDWTHAIVGVEGGWYSGKTWAGARKLTQLHIINAFGNDGQPTFIPSFCVAPTYGNASDFCIPELFITLEECEINYSFKSGGAVAEGKYAAPAIILPDFGTKKKPSCILIRSADIPKRITGFTAGAGWGDEPARWKYDELDPLNDPYIQMLGRIRGVARIKQAIFTYTNEGDITRVYEEFHDGNPEKKLYRAATRTNPHAKEFEELQRGILTSDLAAQYLDGEAMSLRGGRLYGKFDFDVHVKRGLQIRKEIPIQLSFDFNIVPGMHIEIGQYHKDADIFTEIHEIYGPRLDLETGLDLVIAWLKEQHYEFKDALPVEVYGDATGGSEWSGTGQSNYFIIQQKLKDQGIPYRRYVPKSNPLVQDRINAVNCALLDLKGEVHYYISPQCKRLIDDMKKMKRNKVGEIDTTDKKLSHASSAIGYKIWWIRPIKIERNRIGGKVGFG
jgi:hypothetical protein